MSRYLPPAAPVISIFGTCTFSLSVIFTGADAPSTTLTIGHGNTDSVFLGTITTGLFQSINGGNVTKVGTGIFSFGSIGALNYNGTTNRRIVAKPWILPRASR